MTNYEKHIDEWIYLIKGNHLPHCREQELMLDNNLIPALERKDVIIDAERVERGLSLMKYFPFDLLPWEEFQFAVIAGVYVDRDGERDIYFNEIRDIMGRGSGKNGFIDFLAFYFISPLHGVPGYNVDLIANGEAQAATSVQDVYEVVRDPEPRYAKAIAANFSATKEKVTGRKMKAEFRLNTTSTKNKDSKRTGCIIFDEKHQYLDTVNMNTLTSGLGKMKWGRTITITTDGHQRGGVLDQEKQQNASILREYNPDNRVFVNWFRIEDEKEWNDIDCLVKANPSIYYPSFSAMKSRIASEIRNMDNTPEYYPEFLAKRCNFPVSDPEKAVAQWDDIDRCDRGAAFAIEEGMECIGGCDYTKTNDFVGCVLVFRNGGDYHVVHHSFICSQSRDLKLVRAPLKEWESKGWCTFVDDVEVPPDVVVGWFMERASRYRINMIGIDSFRFSLLSREFKKNGFECLTKDRDRKNVWLTRRSDIVKAAPVINSLFVNGRLSGFDRMMCWYTNNAKLILDNSGNMTYGKIEPRSRKTDGFMALVHAMCCLESLPEPVSYENIDLGVYTY